MAKIIDNQVVESLLDVKTNRLNPSIQNTAASTKTLTLSDETLQIFNGTVAGQIVKLPVATTLQNGHLYEIWNFSNKTISINDAGSNALATLNANGRTQILLRDNSTSNGSWGLTYTLDNGNVFGTQVYYVENLTETSTSSGTVWQNKLTFTTPSSLPLGTYLLNFQLIWRAANANRQADLRFQLNGSDIIAWQPTTSNTADRQLLSGFARNVSISGTNTFTFDFKYANTSTTIFVSQAKFFVWRIS